MNKNQKFPKGWKEVKLGEVCEIKKGKQLGRLEMLENGSVPVMNGGILPSGFTNSFNENENTITISEGGNSCGFVSLLKEKFWCGGHCYVLKNLKVEILFLFQILKQKEQEIMRLRVGSGLPNIQKTVIEKFSFYVPADIEEQKAIAGALGIWDVGIEKLSQVIKLKEKQKKAIMQKLLSGKIRLSGFSKPWEEVRLGRIGEISSAGVDKKIVSDEPMVNLLNYMDVYKKNFIYKKDIFWPVSSPISKLKKCNVLAGDIFFTPSSETRDDIANSAVIMEDIPNCVYSYHIVRFRANKEKLFPIFGCYVLKTPQFYKQAYSLCEGSGQRYVISQDGFRNMKITVPADIDEQCAIAGTLSVCDEELALLNKKLALLREQKKSLMQQLLTGKMRLKF